MKSNTSQWGRNVGREGGEWEVFNCFKRGEREL
jgi:hypothetical protein